MDLVTWERFYEGATPAQIREEIEALRVFMFEETNAYYEEQFRAGKYDIVPLSTRADGSYHLDVGDDLAAWRLLPSKQLAKVILPREGFEEAYVAKVKTAWLLREEERKENLVRDPPETTEAR